MHIYRAPISYIALSHGLVRSLELCTPPSPAASTTSNLDNLKHKPHCAISELTCCASVSPSDHVEISSIASWLFSVSCTSKLGDLFLDPFDSTRYIVPWWLDVSDSPASYNLAYPYTIQESPSRATITARTWLLALPQETEIRVIELTVNGRLLYYLIMIMLISHRFC
jgi:hypothetical protein